MRDEIKSERLMAGHWHSLFSKMGKNSTLSFTEENKTSILRDIINCFQERKQGLEDKFAGSFNGGKIELTDKGYITFPDLIFDSNSWYNFFKEETNTLNKEIFNLLNIIRININPCLLKGHKHKTKIYVIPWHIGDISTEKLVNFYAMSDIVAEKIALEIREQYLQCLNKSLKTPETAVSFKFFSDVFFNNEVNNTYEEILEKLKKGHKIEKALMSKMWAPLIDSAYSHFNKSKDIDDYKPFFQTLYIEQQEINSFFGITGDYKNNGSKSNCEITHLIGVTPYPYQATLEIQLPVIEQL